VRVQIYGIPCKMFRCSAENIIVLNDKELNQPQLNDNKYYVKWKMEREREHCSSLFNSVPELLQQIAHLEHQIILTSPRINIAQ
jgi:hypothetical protein